MTESSDTNPRRTIYRKTGVPGIRSVWDFSEKSQKYLQRNSGNRYIATVEKNGRTHSDSFGSIEDARRWREKLKFEFESQPNVEPMTFANLFNEFMQRKRGVLQITTVENYLVLARHFAKLDSLKVEEINSQTIDKIVSEWKSSAYRAAMKTKSIRMSYCHEVVLLRNVFAYYREYFNEGFENPVRKRHDADAIIDRKRIDQRKRDEKHKFVSSEDIELVLNAFQEQVKIKPWKGIYKSANLLQLRSGLRVGEVFALCYEDIDWKTGQAKISKTVQWMRHKNRPSVISERTKTGKDRIVWLLPDVVEDLRQLQRQQGRIRGLIFSEDGQRIATYRSIQHHYGCAFRSAGVDIRSTHILRHSFATHFLEATGNSAALKELLGHSTMKMTEKYAKVTHKITFAGMQAFELSLRQANLRKPEN